MNLWLPILILALASAFGLWWRSKQGQFKKAAAASSPHKFVSNSEIGIELGQRVTILQFSSTFCSPCKATAQMITNLVKNMSDVVYMQIKSEENLQLIQKFDIKSTPTVVFFNGHGMEVGRAVGTPTNDQVLAAISAVR